MNILFITGVLKKVVKAGRWIAPSQSKGVDCAVMEFDIEVRPDTIATAGLITAILRRFDDRVDTDHPVFRYLGRQQEKRQKAQLTLTISMRPTDMKELDIDKEAE